MQSFFASSKNPPGRTRAGIRVPFDEIIEISVDEERSDEQIARAQAGGEIVVNANGRKLINEDAAIAKYATRPIRTPLGIVDDTPPEPTPQRLLDLGAKLGIVVSPVRSVGEPLLLAELKRCAVDAADSDHGRILRRIGIIALDGDTAEIERLCTALECHDDFGDYEELPAIGSMHWASNEQFPVWMRTVATHLCAKLPTVPDPERFNRERVAAYAIAERTLTDGALVNDGFDSSANFVDTPALQAKLFEIAQRQAAVGHAWSEAVDAVRFVVLHAIDHARAHGAGGALAQFALGELARWGRGMPISPAFDPDTLTRIVLTSVALTRAPDGWERAPLEMRVRREASTPEEEAAPKAKRSRVSVVPRGNAIGGRQKKWDGFVGSKS